MGAAGVYRAVSARCACALSGRRCSRLALVSSRLVITTDVCCRTAAVAGDRTLAHRRAVVSVHLCQHAAMGIGLPRVGRVFARRHPRPLPRHDCDHHTQQDCHHAGVPCCLFFDASSFTTLLPLPLAPKLAPFATIAYSTQSRHRIMHQCTA